MTLAEDVLGTIHTGIYWRVVIHPASFESSRIKTLGDCKAVLERARVQLRGWDYPHLADGIQPREDSVEFAFAWPDYHFEYWRLFQSGQFVHHFSAVEAFHRLPWSPAPEKFVLIDGLIYTTTEVFEFASRLAQQGVLSAGATISIELHGVAGAQLVYWDLWRSTALYRPEAKTDVVSTSVEVGTRELVARANELAVDAAVNLIERFGWLPGPRQQLAEDQARMLDRALGR